MEDTNPDTKSYEELRRIDTAVAEKVFNWELMRDTGMTRSGFLTYRNMRNDWDWQETIVPDFSKDISFAWQVIEKLVEMGLYPIIWAKPHIVQICDHDENYVADEKASTIPLAICLAALKAVGVEVTEG